MPDPVAKPALQLLVRQKRVNCRFKSSLSNYVEMWLWTYKPRRNQIFYQGPTQQLSPALAESRDGIQGQHILSVSQGTHAVLRQEDAVQKQNRKKPIDPLYLCFLWQARTFYVPSNSHKLTSPKRPFLKKGPHLQWMGITKQGSLSFQSSRAAAVAQTQVDHLGEAYWDGGQRLVTEWRV